MNQAFTIYDPAVTDSIHTDISIKRLTGDCLFTEGPVWNKEGYYLFSDTTANTVFKIVPGKKKEVFIEKSGTATADDPELKPGQAGSNALAYRSNGGLLVCRHGSHDIALWNGKTLEPFIERYEDKPLNSPNDLIIHRDGRIYFSDPPYGLKDSQLNPSRYQPLAGVYCWQEGMLQMICDRYQYPNGVCLSPDEKYLYICSNKPFEKFVSLYQTGTNRFEKIFAEENSDGIDCDRRGNVYLCNKDGIIILDGEGKRRALISLPTIPSNICWGGKELNDLFITARQNIFLIRGLQKG